MTRQSGIIFPLAAVTMLMLILGMPVSAWAGTHYIIAVSDGWNVAHPYVPQNRTVVRNDPGPHIDEIAALIADAVSGWGGFSAGDQMTLMLVGQHNPDPKIVPPPGCRHQQEVATADLFSVHVIEPDAATPIARQVADVLRGPCNFHRDQILLPQELILAAAGRVPPPALAAEETILAVLTNKAGPLKKQDRFRRLKSGTPGLDVDEEIARVAKLYRVSPLNAWTRDNRATIPLSLSESGKDYPLLLQGSTVEVAPEVVADVLKAPAEVSAIRVVSGDEIRLMPDPDRRTSIMVVRPAGLTPKRATFLVGSPGGRTTSPVTITGLDGGSCIEKCGTDVVEACPPTLSGMTAIMPFQSCGWQTFSKESFDRGATLEVTLTASFDGRGYLGPIPAVRKVSMPLVPPAPAVVPGWSFWVPPFGETLRELVFFSSDRVLTDEWMIRYVRAWGTDFSTETTITSGISRIRKLFTISLLVVGGAIILSMGRIMLFSKKPPSFRSQVVPPAEIPFDLLRRSDGADVVVARFVLERKGELKITLEGHNLARLGLRLSNEQPLYVRVDGKRVDFGNVVAMRDGAQIEICLNVSAIRDFGGPPPTAPRPMALEADVGFAPKTGPTVTMHVKHEVICYPAAPLPPVIHFKKSTAPVSLKRGFVEAGSVRIDSADTDLNFVETHRLRLGVRSNTEGIPDDAFALTKTDMELAARESASIAVGIDGSKTGNVRSVSFFVLCGDRREGPFVIDVEPAETPQGVLVIGEDVPAVPPVVRLTFTSTHPGGVRVLDIQPQGTVKEGEHFHVQPYLDIAQLTETLQPGRDAETRLAKIGLEPLGQTANSIKVEIKASMQMLGLAATQLRIRDNAPAPLMLKGDGANGTQATSLLPPNGRSWNLCLNHRDLQASAIGYPIGVKLELEVRIVHGRNAARPVYLDIPLSLKVSPPDMFLAIDMGTSAIAAAHNFGKDVFLLDLMKVEAGNAPSRNYVDFLREVEKGVEQEETPFLPSHMECNGDKKVPTNLAGPPPLPGYCTYPDETLDIGKPGFVAMPAFPSSYRTGGVRVVYSLKSWVSIMAQRVRLADNVRFRHNGRELEDRDLPMVPLMQSVVSGLLSAFILPKLDANSIGYLVITRPNTYTAKQCEDLLRAVEAAAQACLGSQWSRRQIRLVSESEAVLYAFLSDYPGEAVSNKKSEAVMVYDFGAGTTDISLFAVEWHEGHATPLLKGSVGVQMAGNRIDTILAAMIHTMLQNPDFLASQEISYKYSLMAVTDGVQEKDHQQRVMRFHRSLLQAKVGFTRRWAECGGPNVWNEGAPVPNFAVDVTELVAGSSDIYRMTAEAFDCHLCSPAEHEHIVQVGEEVYLVVPHTVVKQTMEKFCKLAVDDLIAAACNDVDMVVGDLDRVVLSGRGLQWPYVRCRLQTLFRPGILSENLIATRGKGAGQAAKEAVVKGAVHWARFNQGAVTLDHAEVAELAIRCHGASPRLIPRSEWGNPIRLNCDAVSVVENCFRKTQVRGKLALDLFSPVGPEIKVGYYSGQNAVFEQDDNGDVFMTIVDGGQRILLADFSNPARDYRPGWPNSNYLLQVEDMNYV